MYVVKIIESVLFCGIVIRAAELDITDAEYRLMPKVFHLDDFDDCMELADKALYCSVIIQLGRDPSQNKSATWDVIQKAVSNPRYYRHDKLRHGVCVPESCPNATSDFSDTNSLKTGISQCYSAKYQHVGLKAVVTKLHCETNRQFYPIDNVDIAVGIVLGIVIWVVLVASFYEGRARYKTKEEYDQIINTKVGRIIACFSLPKNWEILRKVSTNKDTEPLKCLQGMRFYTVLLVIMVHSALCTLAASVRNPIFVENLTQGIENTILVNCLCTIQSFMVVVGFLLSYNFYLIIGKKKKFNMFYIIYAFINRYIRLTPCLLVVIAVNSTWVYHLGRGPNWDKSLGTEYRNCRQNWWTNILYINNYYDPEHMCMQHAWYLATDTQLFLVSLTVLALMWKFPKWTKFILGFSVTVGFLLPSIVNYYYNYDIIVRMYPEALNSIFLDVPQWHVMYSSSISNFGAYALGITFGYIFYKKRSNKIFNNRLRVTLWWFLVFGTSLGVMMYGARIYQDDFEYTKIGAAAYVFLFRSLYSIGMCFMVYGSAEGIGWFVRDALVWSPIQSLGKLTYTIYLVHAAVIRVRAGQARSTAYFSHYTMLANTAGDAAVSIIFATILALFVELPVQGLQRMMVPQLSKKRGTDIVEERKDNAEKGNGSTEYNHRF